MRMDFGSKEKQKQFFRSAKGADTWREFYEKISKKIRNSQTFKVFEAWTYGRYLPPYEVVKAIHKLSDESENPIKLNIKLVPDNWGSVKGGKSKIKTHGTNLTREDRIKGGRNAPKDPERLRRISHLGFSKMIERKFRGPNGELLFNKLEKEVAEILHASGIDYAYELIIRLEKGFVIPDFVLKGGVVIECIEWTNVREKSSQLKNKIKKLLSSKLIKNAIIVTNQSLLRSYKKNLGEVAEVFTADKLAETLKD